MKVTDEGWHELTRHGADCCEIVQDGTNWCWMLRDGAHGAY